MSETYQIDENSFQPIDGKRLRNSEQSSHKPKVLLLYGSPLHWFYFVVRSADIKNIKLAPKK
tara:strand:+ start:1023 stop:1208 length:186 start_codon:yes stop_codon:yes gene_type:complete